MKATLSRIAGCLVLALVGFAAASSLSPSAVAHISGCHSAHTCPSDHHSYVWTDTGTGLSWDCAAPTADEYDPALDTTTIVYDGITYMCRSAGGTTTTTSTSTTTSTTTTATEPTSTTTTTEPTTTERTTTTTQTGGTKEINVGKTVLLKKRTKTSHCKRGPNPDRRCSPGAYYSKLTKKVLCSASFRTGSIRNVPQSEKYAVEREYGMKARLYGRTLEIDHIVSLELGGSNDIANLFPERASPAPGYKVKDKLENKLHDLVCSGQMTLSSARVGIATNWQKLYRKVYGTAPAA